MIGFEPFQPNKLQYIFFFISVANILEQMLTIYEELLSKNFKKFNLKKFFNYLFNQNARQFSSFKKLIQLKI